MEIILEPPSVQLLCIWRKSNVVPEPQQRFTLNYFHLNCCSSAKKNSVLAWTSQQPNPDKFPPIRVRLDESVLWGERGRAASSCGRNKRQLVNNVHVRRSSCQRAGNPTGLLSMRLNLKVWRQVKVFQRARPLSVSVNYFKKILFPNSPVSDCLMFVHSNKNEKRKKHLEWKNALMRVSFKPSWGFIVDGRGSQSGCCDGRPGVPQDNYIIVSIFLYHTNDIIHVLLKYEVTLNHSLTQPRWIISRFPCLREINRLCKCASTLQLKLLFLLLCKAGGAHSAILWLIPPLSTC